MSHNLRIAERLKFHLLAEGLLIREDVRRSLLRRIASDRLSPADFASTSGVILRLDDDVWVNAPIADFNPNFVEASAFVLDSDTEGLVVRGRGFEVRASFWLPPRYHGTVDGDGTPRSNFVFTHGDRVRVSPIRGCRMTCKFCDIPYGDRYGTKSIPAMLDALRIALTDDIQPARHILVSGGTPRSIDHEYVRDVYESILLGFPDVDVDIMMVPVPGLLDVKELARLGVHELSINLELFDDDAARRLMPHKYRQGRDSYLDFIADAVAELGPGRVRSMLMVGLEPMERTLAGVDALIARGAVPVLSPFRPDPATPLGASPPPDAATLEGTFLRAEERMERAGMVLGPRCPPCTHNTLTLPSRQPAVEGSSLPPMMI